MAGFKQLADVFFFYFLIAALVGLCYAILGQLFAALFPTVALAQLMGGLMLTLLALFNGAFVNAALSEFVLFSSRICWSLTHPCSPFDHTLIALRHASPGILDLALRGGFHIVGRPHPRSLSVCLQWRRGSRLSSNHCEAKVALMFWGGGEGCITRTWEGSLRNELQGHPPPPVRFVRRS